jgi:predicted nucleic acid-binding protein
VTNPRIYRPATPIAAALDQVAAWMESPGLVLLSESDATWDILRDVVVKGRATGGTIHDARIATLCLENAIDELWTADRDFGRFRGVKVRNPLV